MTTKVFKKFIYSGDNFDMEMEISDEKIHFHYTNMNPRITPKDYNSIIESDGEKFQIMPTPPNFQLYSHEPILILPAGDSTEENGWGGIDGDTNINQVFEKLIAQIKAVDKNDYFLN